MMPLISVISVLVRQSNYVYLFLVSELLTLFACSDAKLVSRGTKQDGFMVCAQCVHSTSKARIGDASTRPAQLFALHRCGLAVQLLLHRGECFHGVTSRAAVVRELQCCQYCVVLRRVLHVCGHSDGYEASTGAVCQST